MYPTRNVAAHDRSPELQVGKLSTISSADGIFIHHVLLQGKDRHLLGSAMVRHIVPPCFYYIHFSSICQEKYIQLFCLSCREEFCHIICGNKQPHYFHADISEQMRN